MEKLENSFTRKTLSAKPDFLSKKAIKKEERPFKTKSESPYETVDLLKNFNKLCSVLDELSVKTDDVETENNFEIREKNKKKVFPRGEIEKLDDPEEKEILKIEIALNDNFSYENIPELIKEVEKKHNEFIKSEERENAEKLNFFLNGTKMMSAEYKHWEKFIAKAIEEKDKYNLSEKMVKHLTNYQEALEHLSNLFSGKEEDNFKIERNQQIKEEEENVLRHMERTEKRKQERQRIIEKKDDKKSKFTDEERENAFLRRVDNAISKAIQKSLEKNLEDMIFKRAEKEIWRQSDVPEIFKSNFAKFRFTHHDQNETNKKIVETLERWLSENDNSTIETLKMQQSECKQLENKIKEETNPEAVKQLKEKLSEKQKTIANTINAILYSEEFWKYKKNKYEPKSSVQYKEVNCITRRQIIKLVWKNFFNKDVYDVLTKTHISTAMKLANGKMLNLEREPREVNFNFQEKTGIQYLDKNKKIWFIASQKGEDNLYRAAIYDWLGGNKNIYYHKKAIALSPENPCFRNNYILALLHNKIFTSADEKAEISFQYKRCIALAPQDLDYRNASLFWLLNQKNFEEADKQCKNTIKLIEKNITNEDYEEEILKNLDCLITVANFYDEGSIIPFLDNVKSGKEDYEKFHNPKEALRLYKKILKKMETIKRDLSQEEESYLIKIKDRVEKLEKDTD